MRRLLLLLAACGSSGDDCFPVTQSNVRHVAQQIFSGNSQIAITWGEATGSSPPIGHGAIVDATGAITTDIHAQMGQVATVGSTTAAWWGHEDSGCGLSPHPFSVTLQRGGNVTFIDIDLSNVFTSEVVFDGTAYQLFWSGVDGTLHHRSLTEDGMLGPLHDLPFGGGACIDAASDGAGTTIVRSEVRAFVVDTATGMTRQVFAGPAGAYSDMFWFAGQFHIRDGTNLYSFASTSSGVYTTRNLAFPVELFFPGPTTMLVESAGAMLEVDPALKVLRNIGPAIMQPGALAGTYVHFDEQFPDGQTPGRIDLVLEGGWRQTVAVDSELQTVEECGDTLGTK